MLIIPWFSLFFMKKAGIKRYIPVVIFTALIVTITHEIAHAFKWWVALDSIVPWGYITNVSYSYGYFLVGTLWIFYLTYEKFWLFVVTNFILDWIWAFPTIQFLEKMKIFQYVNINEWILWLIAFSQSLMIYSFKSCHEKTFKLKK
jgi:hypothetical protein